MQDATEIDGYAWEDGELTCAHDYLLPTVTKLLMPLPSDRRKLFDLGCGNGSVTAYCELLGYDVVGVDPSERGVKQANAMHPNLRIALGSAYEDLASKYGTFDVVLSLEVVEHVYDPRRYAATLFSLVNETGKAIVSTPYHGYGKNLALAISGKMDKHFTALWDHGHIKFWSMKTLAILLEEAGFVDIKFHRVGRVPFLAKSMIAVASRPA